MWLVIVDLLGIIWRKVPHRKWKLLVNFSFFASWLCQLLLGIEVCVGKEATGALIIPIYTMFCIYGRISFCQNGKKWVCGPLLLCLEFCSHGVGVYTRYFGAKVGLNKMTNWMDTVCVNIGPLFSKDCRRVERATHSVEIQMFSVALDLHNGTPS